MGRTENAIKANVNVMTGGQVINVTNSLVMRDVLNMDNVETEHVCALEDGTANIALFVSYDSFDSILVYIFEMVNSASVTMNYLYNDTNIFILLLQTVVVMVAVIMVIVFWLIICIVVFVTTDGKGKVVPFAWKWNAMTKSTMIKVPTYMY